MQGSGVQHGHGEAQQRETQPGAARASSDGCLLPAAPHTTQRPALPAGQTETWRGPLSLLWAAPRGGRRAAPAARSSRPRQERRRPATVGWCRRHARHTRCPAASGSSAEAARQGRSAMLAVLPAAHALPLLPTTTSAHLAVRRGGHILWEERVGQSQTLTAARLSSIHACLDVGPAAGSRCGAPGFWAAGPMRGQDAGAGMAPTRPAPPSLLHT